MIMQIQMVGTTSVKKWWAWHQKNDFTIKKTITNGTIKQLDANSHQKTQTTSRKNDFNIKTCIKLGVRWISFPSVFPRIWDGPSVYCHQLIENVETFKQWDARGWFSDKPSFNTMLAISLPKILINTSSDVVVSSLCYTKVGDWGYSIQSEGPW